MKILLVGSVPQVWRRVVISPELSLEELHEVIQIAMGWENYHLYEFSACGESIGNSGCGGDSDQKVQTLLSLQNELDYWYDMGDYWHHRITLVKTGCSLPKGVAKVVSWKGDCPSEDIGGIHVHNDVIKKVKKTTRKKYEQWLGLPYDLKENNKQLENLY
ncbi:MAG: plasmid pRiA4b ORF-3 family protein [Carnobacterium maltaromaticum]